MTALILCSLLLLSQDQPARTPSVYRCPASEAESKFFEPLMSEEGFDAVCIEPKPGPNASKIIKEQKLKTITAKEIDTPDNLKWRNLTLDFVNGKVSPRQWVAATAKLKTTVHFLSSPQTKDLRTATGQESGRAVFAEMLLLSWPGKPCLTHNDTGQTRYLPESDRLVSWLLAMRDYLGPMLHYRASHPFMATGKPTILRADDKPGLLVFRTSKGSQSLTFYLNNGPKPIELPSIDEDRMTIMRAMDFEGDKPKIMPTGFLIEDGTGD